MPDANWTVQLTSEAHAWFKGLNERDADRIAAALDLLEERGPALGRKAVDSIRGSRHHNMKELRSFGGNLRALFAFDPQRRAVVLIGGDKTNDWKGWYKRNIPLADNLYDRHLRSLGGCRATSRRLGVRAPRCSCRQERARRISRCGCVRAVFRPPLR